ncbi:MAG TPA: hypothetical protein VFP66_14335 [Candidatus Limnocylindrales bacterium]|nr:hypothetical protein [Candidatus Limnocylindrales bacterium]
MAKRDEIARQGLIILDAKGVADVRGTARRLEDAGVGVLHRYGSRVLIGEVPPAGGRSVAAKRGVRSFHAGAVRDKPRGLSEAEAAGLAAWNLRVSRRYATAKAKRPLDGERWDAAGVTPLIPPDGPLMTHVSDEGPARAFGPGDETSAYLIGAVAVGLILVEGPTADLQFSEAERTKVVAEVQEGLTWLGSQEAKAGVSFAYDIRIVRVDRAPNPALSGYEPLEAHWRDPAMAKIGFAPNFGGVKEYVKTIRANLATKWGYVAFFTKYPVQHFAYASKPRLVMHYDNDGWGPDNIDRVFTHETGHIFGCPDEYAASNCSCDTKAGHLREVNGNCQNCATSFTPCLMAGNTWAMCAFTPVHLGWRDTDGDGALDPVDPVGNPNPLVDLGRFCSRFPFLCRLFGLGATAGAVAGEPFGVIGVIAREPRPEAVPVELLRQVLTADEMERVETAVRAEEDRYLESLERKLQTAVDQIARERARR